MNFFKKYKKIIIIIIIVSLLAAYSAVIFTRQYGKFGVLTFSQEFVRYEPIYIKVGETYDMRDMLIDAENALSYKQRMQCDGAFSLNVSKNVLQRNDTKIKAATCGLGITTYDYNYTSHYFPKNPTDRIGYETKSLMQADFIVLSEESEYVEVQTIADLTDENKTFILKNDIIISDTYSNYYILDFFTGVLLNPDGYTITIEESSGIKAICLYNLGVFEGINISANIGYCEFLIPLCGLAISNEGLIIDCDAEIELELKYGNLYINNVYNSTLIYNHKIRYYDTEVKVGHNYSYFNIKSNDIILSFRGNTENIYECDYIIPQNTRLRKILE